MTADRSSLQEARAWLSGFVMVQAERTAESTGFRWTPAEDAPDTFERLRDEFAECLVSGRPLKVATVNVAPSIFLSAEANWAMRFWHDVTHVELDQGFGLEGESVVAAKHLRALEGAGQPPGSVAWQLLRADTMGQNFVYALTCGGFVRDQWAFTLSALRLGLPFAVLEAVEQIEGRPIAGGDVEALGALLVASP